MGNERIMPRTKQQREAQLRVMEKALVEGLTPDEVVAAAASRFGISTQAAQRDLNTLRERLAAQGRAIRPTAADPAALALAILRRDRIYQQAIQHNDRRIALEAEKDRCRLLGVYPDDHAVAAEPEDADLDRAIERELANLAANRTATAAEGTAAAYPRLADLPAD